MSGRRTTRRTRTFKSPSIALPSQWGLVEKPSAVSISAQLSAARAVPATPDVRALFYKQRRAKLRGTSRVARSTHKRRGPVYSAPSRIGFDPYAEVPTAPTRRKRATVRKPRALAYSF